MAHINEKEKTITFYTENFQSKWGFDDGDFDLYGYREPEIEFSRDDFADFLMDVLSKMVESDHEFYRICTHHNQVRTDDERSIIPEAIEMPIAEFVEYIRYIQLKSGRQS